MAEPKTVIVHGVRITKELISPRAGREYAELWGVTRCNVKYWDGQLLDWTRWFELHPLESSGEWLGIREKRPQAWAWYRQQDTSRPIYMATRHPGIPASVKFDLEALQQRFGLVENLARGVELCRQFTCMLDYVMAFALFEGFKRIILNGIGFATDHGHQYVHRGILYWIGFARGMGVEVLIDPPSVYAMPREIYAYQRFGFDELRGIRRSLSTAQRRAAGYARRGDA